MGTFFDSLERVVQPTLGMIREVCLHMAFPVTKLDNESLLEAYERAKELNLDPLFVEILKDEIDRRNLPETDKIIKLSSNP